MAEITATSIRLLAAGDTRAVAHITLSSAWVAQHFTPAELPRLLATLPAVGVFDARGSMRAFLLATSLVPPSGWLGGFGVPWAERARVAELLDAAFPLWSAQMAARGARTIYYSGHDQDNDLLHDTLLARGFHLHELLRSYDKIGTASPAGGNPWVAVRPFAPARDLAGVLAIEDAAFDPPWRHDAAEFSEIAATYPFFIVAETPTGEIAGYQFSTVDGDTGYLVRIAVRPDLHSQSIGTRLMAEAMAYFTRAGATRVLLNAEDANTRAHRLYEWFGFEMMPPRGFGRARAL
jgi:ribosomal-protein-alanine N-acetyltransferase